MKKNLISIISAILALLMFIYAYIQKLEADVQAEKAIAAQLLAVEARKEADQQRVLAMANEALAKQKEHELLVCRNEKK